MSVLQATATYAAAALAVATLACPVNHEVLFRKVLQGSPAPLSSNAGQGERKSAQADPAATEAPSARRSGRGS